MPRASKAPIGTKVEGKLRKQGPEAKLKAYAIRLLNASGLLWWRNQSGAIRVSGKGGRSYMVRMGTPGLPDLMVLGNDGCLWCIELKAPKGKIRPEQSAFFAKCWYPTGLKGGANYHVKCFFARSEKHIDDILFAAITGGEIDQAEYQK